MAIEQKNHSICKYLNKIWMKCEQSKFIIIWIHMLFKHTFFSILTTSMWSTIECFLLETYSAELFVVLKLVLVCSCALHLCRMWWCCQMNIHFIRNRSSGRDSTYSNYHSISEFIRRLGNLRKHELQVGSNGIDWNHILSGTFTIQEPYHLFIKKIWFLYGNCIWKYMVPIGSIEASYKSNKCIVQTHLFWISSIFHFGLADDWMFIFWNVFGWAICCCETGALMRFDTALEPNIKALWNEYSLMR